MCVRLVSQDEVLNGTKIDFWAKRLPPSVLLDLNCSSSLKSWSIGLYYRFWIYCVSTVLNDKVANFRFLKIDVFVSFCLCPLCLCFSLSLHLSVFVCVCVCVHMCVCAHMYMYNILLICFREDWISVYFVGSFQHLQNFLHKDHFLKCDWNTCSPGWLLDEY